MRAVPTKCDECGSVKIHLMKIGKRRTEVRKNWPYVYHCRSCSAETGCHTGTVFPLGIMACPHTRYMRKMAHKAFDKLWNNKACGLPRAEAYDRLASYMGLTRDTCHIGMFTAAQCEVVIEYSKVTRRELKGRRR